MTDDTGKVIAEVGGPIDECGVCLAIYGEDLDPDELTARFGCQPTHAHRRGDKRGPRSLPAQKGAWLLELRGEPPDTAEVLTRRIVQSVPSDPELWRHLKDRFVFQMRYGIHLTGWNKGFELPAELVASISRLYASLEFDIYAYGEDDAGPSSEHPT